MPLGTAHFGKLYASVLIALADIFAERLELVTGDEQSVRACVTKLDIVLCNAVDRHGLDALEERDAVARVHDVVTDREVGIAHKALACATRFFQDALTATVLHHLAPSVARHREHRDFRHDKLKAARFTYGNKDCTTLGGGKVDAAVICRDGCEPLVGEGVKNALCSVYRICDDDGSVHTALQVG